MVWRTDVGKGAGPNKGAGVGTMTCSPEPYVFKDSTTPSARFCYKPGVDLDPPERMERCNDSFLAGTLHAPASQVEANGTVFHVPPSVWTISAS